MGGSSSSDNTTRPAPAPAADNRRGEREYGNRMPYVELKERTDYGPGRERETRMQNFFVDIVDGCRSDFYETKYALERGEWDLLPKEGCTESYCGITTVEPAQRPDWKDAIARSMLPCSVRRTPFHQWSQEHKDIFQQVKDSMDIAEISGQGQETCSNKNWVNKGTHCKVFGYHGIVSYFTDDDHQSITFWTTWIQHEWSVKKTLAELDEIAEQYQNYLQYECYLKMWDFCKRNPDAQYPFEQLLGH